MPYALSRLTMMSSLLKLYSAENIFTFRTLSRYLTTVCRKNSYSTDNYNAQNNQFIRVNNHGRVFQIELNRPEKFNAISLGMYNEITDALNQSNECHKTSVTMMSAAGDYYCAGNDLSDFLNCAETGRDMSRIADEGEKILDRFVRAYIMHEKPLIALVNGPAIGISVTVLALFDMVIASDKATFHTPFSSLGQSPEGCSSYTFPLLMGPSKACEMLLFDKKITAKEAQVRNLVTTIIENNSFREEADQLVSKLAELPPESLRVNKQLIRHVHRENLLSVCKHECAVLKQRWLSEECQKALQKFKSRKHK